MIDPQTAATIKGQEVAANQQSANDKAPRFRAEAAEKSKHAAVMSNAVSHLNKQMGREPKIGWDMSETQP